MPGHMGAYIGKKVSTVMVLSMLLSTWGRGIKYSYVDAKGRRLYGKTVSQNGSWESHSLPSD